MKLKLPFLIFLIISILVGGKCYGQIIQGAIPNDRSINNYITEQWTTEDGLVTNKIIKIKQASDGYIWLVTYDGIVRYDGISFDLYNAENTSEIGQNTFYDIVESKDSTLWFVSRGDGILKYKDKQFSKFQMAGIPESMRSIFIDSRQRLWIAGYEKLYVVEGEDIQTLDHPSIIKGETLAIAEDSEGVIYFGTNGNGIVTYDGTNYSEYTKEDGLNDDVIVSLCKGPNETMIVGTFFGISVIENKSIRNIPFVEEGRVNDILVDNSNNILLATDMGFYRINEPLEIYEKISEGHRLPAREINGVEIDHEGSIWLGMERGGLLQFKLGKIERYTVLDGLSLNRVNIIQQRNEDEFWVGSDNGDIDIINIKNNSISPLNLIYKTGKNGVRDILFDKNVTWVASYDGLLKIYNNEIINYTEENLLSSRLVRRVIKDSRGNIWVATRSGGVNKIDKEGRVEVYDKKRGLKSNYILAIHEADDKIYLGTNRGGISIIDVNGNIKNYDNPNDEFGDAVYFNIRSDKKGRIWIVGSNGLLYLENEKLNSISVKNWVGSNVFFDIIDDGVGSFWLTTSKGIIQISISEINSYLAGKKTAVNFQLYNDSDGLPSSECTAATRTLIDTKGHLWIPTNGGVGRLDPGSINSNKVLAPTYIKYFKVDDEYLQASKSSNIIKPGHVRYSIGFTALSYLAPGNVQFKYRLRGLDKDWSYSNGMQREIEYTNIDPGSYTFEVFATNNDGLWNPTGDSFVFEVEPYIYQNTWFYLLVIVVVVTIFLLLARWRLARVNKRNVELQKLNAELDSFVYSTSHDLRAPLASMLGLLNIAKLDNDPKQKNSYMELMESSIKKLDGFIQDIIDYSRNTRLEVIHTTFNIYDMVEDIMEELKYMDPEKMIDKQIVMEGDVVVLGDRQRIRVILNNIISNALKYYDLKEDQCKVSILIRNNEQGLYFEIEDNGIGIEKDQLKHVFEMFYRATERSKGSGIGLYIVKETINKMRGTVQINSTHGKGTTLKIRIPTP